MRNQILQENKIDISMTRSSASMDSINFKLKIFLKKTDSELNIYRLFSLSSLFQQQSIETMYIAFTFYYGLHVI